MDFSGLKYLVVGSGFYGSVMAERIASVLNEKVLVIEKRSHFGGNSFSEPDSDTNIEVHKYGSHIFHTSNEKVFNYLRRFTEFNEYRHRVITIHKTRPYSMPINLLTINQFFSTNFSPSEAQSFISAEISRDRVPEPRNLEEKAISLIGRPLYEAFIRGYTQKQWGISPLDLPAQIITRLPVRFNYNDRYFSDTFEGQPVDGYGSLFKRMLTHPNIEVRLNLDFFEIRHLIPKDCLVIYSGPIDRFFDFRLGYLQWRTIELIEERAPINDFQGNSVVNYADEDVPFTRIHEFKHYHPERKQSTNHTIIHREYSRAARTTDTPYYPVNTSYDAKILAEYKKAAAAEKNVIFGGRLGNYVYIDMHQAVAMALNGFEILHQKRLQGEN